MKVDIVTLERLAQRIEEDCRRGNGLTNSAAISIADIIKRAIGAPLNWPSRVAGVHYADDTYPGSPTHRAGFNDGVKWAVEHYSPTQKPTDRFGRPKSE